MFQKKWLKQYALLFAAVVLIGTALLYLAGLLPQENIHANLQRSAAQFQHEGEAPFIFNGDRESYRLDAFSESLILNHSYLMDTRTSPITIFSNPAYRDGWHPVSSLIRLTEDPQLEPNSNRSHYWLGSRVIARSLLCVLPYQEIRGVLSMAFFTLCLAAMLCLQRKGGTPPALCLGLTVTAVNPVIISMSLQFSLCFLIAFAGVIGVCLTHRRPRALWLVFILAAQLTQYFDFYTAPLITWGLPFVALIAIRRAQDGLTLKESLKLFGGSLLAWGASYMCMWLLRLILVTLLTDINGLAVFTNQLPYYTGMREPAAGQIRFSAWGALAACLANVFVPSNLIMLGAGLAALIVYWLRLRRQGGLRLANAGVWIYALAGVLPALWLVAARQASGKHAYFQYRTLTVLVFAVFCFAAQLLEPKQKTLKD